ncbi:hypothetical protein P175DRAFT_0502870 [Aspergillus ochraceoroseus IBT 24754]|uniref:Copper transporter n=1 Tax=Aspergillus ochraceoroseus IBT 24754 TaxID=1392256 RepID=A0A2T5LSS3_9EURO|nr:uncharacterized protein P175DRAFT_0502870 [Aspergillus ochraceoroseus IBT 24754]PTU19333.1 hypothetical protein P175DRAFT_0502870 [Aspergillus ochraceoroseus IBT 24754]
MAVFMVLVAYLSYRVVLLKLCLDKEGSRHWWEGKTRRISEASVPVWRRRRQHLGANYANYANNSQQQQLQLLLWYFQGGSTAGV